jgi:hypothetical protein
MHRSVSGVPTVASGGIKLRIQIENHISTEPINSTVTLSQVSVGYHLLPWRVTVGPTYVSQTFAVDDAEIVASEVGANVFGYKTLGKWAVLSGELSVLPAFNLTVSMALQAGCRGSLLTKQWSPTLSTHSRYIGATYSF